MLAVRSPQRAQPQPFTRGSSDMTAYRVIASELRMDGDTFPHGSVVDIPEGEVAGLLRFGAISATEATTETVVSGAISAAATEKVDLNTATIEQLNAIDLIGPATANRIVAGRPYSTIEQAKQASKLGDEKWGQIADLVEVREVK